MIFFYLGLVLYVISIISGVRCIKVLQAAGFVDLVRPGDYCMYITKKWEPSGAVDMTTLATEFKKRPAKIEKKITLWNRQGFINATFTPDKSRLVFNRTGMTMPGTSVYVSYSYKDYNQVKSELDYLEKSDVKILPKIYGNMSEQWKASIEARIGECFLFLVFISKNAVVESECVLEEINHAIRQNITVLPVYLDGTRLPDKVIYDIGMKQHLDMKKKAPDEFRAALLTTIQRFLPKAQHG
nr:toll/interleukin-1 receptor domain-containing protein [Candidatus Sigynarchaeota archaeon]